MSLLRTTTARLTQLAVTHGSCPIHTLARAQTTMTFTRHFQTRTCLRSAVATNVATPVVRDAFINPTGLKNEDIFRDFALPVGNSVDDRNAHTTLREHVNCIFREYRPSHHPFFKVLANAPSEVIRDRKFLAAFYHRYQACMHATRAAVYFAPHLNTPSLRQRKIAIILDDDSNSHDSHHVQLYKLFLSMGCTEADLAPHESFGDGIDLAATFKRDGPSFEPNIAQFIETADRLYRLDTGAWCIAEVLSDDWLSALAKSFASHSHLAHVPTQPYFDEILVGNVEIQHMLETVSMTEEVLSIKPELLPQVLENMETMADQMNRLWSTLQTLVEQHTARLNREKRN